MVFESVFSLLAVVVLTMLFWHFSQKSDLIWVCCKIQINSVFKCSSLVMRLKIFYLSSGQYSLGTGYCLIDRSISKSWNASKYLTSAAIFAFYFAKEWWKYDLKVWLEDGLWRFAERKCSSFGWSPSWTERVVGGWRGLIDWLYSASAKLQVRFTLEGE